jgi:hypothetical protein
MLPAMSLKKIPFICNVVAKAMKNLRTTTISKVFTPIPMNL